MDLRSLIGGTLWAEEITLAIETCKVVIFFLSANSAQSDKVGREVQLAFEKE
jgi:hypothetical protein